MDLNLTVIEPINSPFQEFKGVDEFNIFYQKNKETIDPITTHKLNKMYKIEGYRITKIKGVLSLKKAGKNYYQKQCSPFEDRVVNLEECYQSINDQLEDIEERLSHPTKDNRIEALQKDVEAIRNSYTELIKGLKQAGICN
jgi:predicted  nucleic acid-binding Zn-ribbon protein